MVSVSYTNVTDSLTPPRMVRSVPIHVRSGLLSTSTILHGSYDMAMLCVMSIKLATTRCILALTLSVRQR